MSHVAVLRGGRSLEREVSLRSGTNVIAALRRLGHEVTSIDVGHDLVEVLREAAPDVAFVALHGRDGEDGTVQELLELLGIPFTGSGVAACLQAADKIVAKHLMRGAGIPTPDFYAFAETAFKELGATAALPAIEQRLGFPIVVKPAAQGSALGLKIAPDAGAVPLALVTAFSYDRRVLLERHIAGRDLSVSVLEEDGGPRALPIVEAVPDEGDLYEARYEIGRTSFSCPAELTDAEAAAVTDVALRTWELFGCAGFARIDVMLDPDDGPQVLELNTVPGMTVTSLLPQAAAAVGIEFDELVARILTRAKGA